MGAVGPAVLAELERPNAIDLDWFASRVSQRAEEGARARVERVDPAPGSVVADQNRVAHRTEITRRLRQTPGRMERAMDRKVLLQLTVGGESVHEATLRFVEGRISYPNVAIDILNPVGRKFSRDLRVHKGIG